VVTPGEEIITPGEDVTPGEEVNPGQDVNLGEEVILGERSPRRSPQRTDGRHREGRAASRRPKVSAEQLKPIWRAKKSCVSAPKS